jgi:curli production assembly/transport component CsgF
MKLNLTSLCLLLPCFLSAHADELVYQPVNPSFGGNPLNGNWLLNNAQAQNTFEDDVDLRDEEQSDLDNFNELLQRSILSRVASAITKSIVGEGGELMPGTIETSDFIIDIVDVGGGELMITTTDKATGESTSFSLDSNI